MPGAQLLQQVEPIEARQAEVEQQQVEAFGAQGMQGAEAILQPIQGVAFGAQRHANALAEGAVIFDEEQAHSEISVGNGGIMPGSSTG
ncbi:hypothetical protein [Pseudomonas sp. 22 E 5]|nr:hypothetical protein [Pseudomonas sp. 22 E 5]